MRADPLRQLSRRPPVPAVTVVAVGADEPPRYATSPCEGPRCKAPVIWATVARTARAMPVDAQPVGAAAGNILLSGPLDRPLAEVVGARQMARLFGKRWVYRSHFVSCPHAEQYRTPRGAP